MAGEGSASLSETGLDFGRIDYLLTPVQFQDVRVTIIGLGSGGAPVCDHLTMNGIRQWDLYDPDVLSEVNLVKHPRLRRDLGRPKVDIQKEWILDRNPSALVQAFACDVMESAAFADSVRTSDLVLACPDKKSVREYVSDKCVEYAIPFVTASVFRTGIGGEVYGYIPGETGCYRCLQLFSLMHDLDLADEALGLTDEERERVYGLDERDFRASGLSIDIQMIAMIQARMALSVLCRAHKTTMPLLKSNWVIFANRPAKGVFQSHFEAKQMRLKPQRCCSCSGQAQAGGPTDA